jgi:ATP-dependent DNA helicase DinG
VVQGTEGFRGRAGQRAMAEQVARTFSQAQLGKVDEEGEPRRAIAVIQAGTGVGKSLAYCAPAIAMALARGTRVLISTATVALQEQLVHKTCPRSLRRWSNPSSSRWPRGAGAMCKLKLERLAGTGEAHAEDDDDLFPEEAAHARASRRETEARMQFYASMAQALAQGGWDGDRDSLDTPPEPEAWSPVAAEALVHRAALPGLQPVRLLRPAQGAGGRAGDRGQPRPAAVVLGARVLPELDNCLLVLDEAHHLPATALDQFACSADRAASPGSTGSPAARCASARWWR